MAERPKLDLGLTGYDELFMTDSERQQNKLPRIHDVPLELIDDFPGHPFKVRMVLHICVLWMSLLTE